MNILSWNVLLRDHEERYNPDSTILSLWNQEKYREDKIINILEKYSDENSIILLQEVSLLLLKKIKDTFVDKSIFTHQISENEYLTTITPLFYNKEEFEQIEGTNGFLIVIKDKIRIINTHLIPQRYTKHNVLKYILNLPLDIYNIIGGDFNESWKRVNNLLESRYDTPFFGNTYKKKQVDFIIFDKKLNYTYISEHILCENISDHNLIKIIIV